MIFARRGIDINKYPTVKNHLYKFYKELKPKENSELIGRKPGNYEWYEIQDNIAYYKDFDKPKIFWQELSRSGNAFCYVLEPMLIMNTAFIMTCEDEITLKYLLAILNHPISLFYLEQVYNKLDETGWRWFKVAVEKIPIPTAPNHKKKIISYMVDEISMNMSESRDKEIEEIINDIYGITQEEYLFMQNKTHSLLANR
jgi:hypothetical protein